MPTPEDPSRLTEQLLALELRVRALEEELLRMERVLVDIANRDRVLRQINRRREPETPPMDVFIIQDDL